MFSKKKKRSTRHRLFCLFPTVLLHSKKREQKGKEGLGGQGCPKHMNLPKKHEIAQKFDAKSPKKYEIARNFDTLNQAGGGGGAVPPSPTSYATVLDNLSEAIKQ